jgi:protein arginine kinase activator
MDDEEQSSNCESCGRDRASIHMTDFVAGRAREHHLCERCYTEREGTVVPHAVFDQLLKSVAPSLMGLGSRQCPACGITYLEFRHGFRLGCSNDYEVFAEPLEKVLEQVHGATRHCGKTPTGLSADAVGDRIHMLRRRQDKAVAGENYELAAELRDHIAKLQSNKSDA